MEESIMTPLLKKYLAFVKRNQAKLQFIADKDNDQYRFGIQYDAVFDMLCVQHTHNGDWDFCLDDLKAFQEYEEDFEKIINEFTDKLDY